MRYLLLAAVLMASQPGHCQLKDADNLRALNAQFIHGYIFRDTASLSHIFADDFILINPSGQRRNRREVLDGFISSPRFSVCDVDTVEIRLFGNIGLVHARAVFKSDDRGKVSGGITDYLDVYEKRKGSWVAVAAHVTYLGDR